MPYISGFDDFKKLQNCEVIQIERSEHRDAWLFVNGAACVLLKTGMNKDFEGHDPPTERFALLRAKRLFVSAKLSKEASDYKAALSRYQEQAMWALRSPHTCPAVPAGAADAMREGLLYIEKLRGELKELDAQLAESPEAVLARQRRELAQQDVAIRAAKHAERQRTADELSVMPSPLQTSSPDIVQEVGRYLRNSM